MVKTHNYYTELFGIPTQKRAELSAPYQMSKVKSTLHQVIRDWSEEVELLFSLHSRGKKSVTYAMPHCFKPLKSMFPFIATKMAPFLQKTSFFFCYFSS